MRAGTKITTIVLLILAQFEVRKVIAFWDGVSKGTAHSFKLAEKYHNQLHVIRVGKL